jgi:hypothetical protein
VCLDAGFPVCAVERRASRNGLRDITFPFLCSTQMNQMAGLSLGA